MTIRYIDEVPAHGLKGLRVLVRAGFDVPLVDGKVGDMFRVRRSAQTLSYLHKAGARVIVLSHLGRDSQTTNAPVAAALNTVLPTTYVPDLLGHAARNAIQAMRDGQVLLLENLRSDPREVACDEGFARELASLGELFVSDAFSAAHRAHASTVALPALLPAFGGILMRQELEALSSARAPRSPSFAILGGAKFETKAPLIRSLLESYDGLFVAGALANDVLKAQGYPIGRSLISKELPGEDVLKHPHFIAPADVVAESEDGQVATKKPQDVGPGDKIVDIGPDSIARITPSIEQAAFILWNGPTGLYEEGYRAWTERIAQLIAKRVAAGGQAVIGGGDTIAAIQGAGVAEEDLGFLSTGGGAMLEYLLSGTLPAIQALEGESGRAPLPPAL